MKEYLFQFTLASDMGTWMMENVMISKRNKLPISSQDDIVSLQTPVMKELKDMQFRSFIQD